MRRPIRPIPIGPRLKISFEDRLQDELQRPLDHTVTDSRYRKNADFALSFGISFFRTRMGRYVLVTNSVRICSRKLSTPLCSIASNVTPSIPGAPSLLLAIR
jgi:hypothetical protein